MAKSHDDPEEVDPVEQRRRAREAWERREARRTHPGSEDTGPPPPIQTPWPTSESVGAPSAIIVVAPPPHVRRLGDWGKYIAGIVAGAGALYAVGAPVVTWFYTRPSDQDVRDARTYCAGVAASAAASALAPYPPRLEQLEKRAARTDERWDGLDDHNEDAATKAHRPVPPKFGPAAEARGDVRQWKQPKGQR